MLLLKYCKDHWKTSYHLDIQISHPLVIPFSLNLLEFTQSHSLTLSLPTFSGFQTHAQALILGIFLEQIFILTLPRCLYFSSLKNSREIIPYL